MIDTNTPLIAEFLRDHQHFSRLLYEIKKLLRDGQVEQARRRARELDAMAGAHIAYEESELYPRLAKLGEKSTPEDLLVRQHHEIREAVRSLIDGSALDTHQLKSIEAAFDAGLSHAEHCGTLISLMSLLDKDEQTDSLVELKRFREEGSKWTELEVR